MTVEEFPRPLQFAELTEDNQHERENSSGGHLNSASPEDDSHLDAVSLDVTSVDVRRRTLYRSKRLVCLPVAQTKQRSLSSFVVCAARLKECAAATANRCAIT
jgi:hypothetical protein